MCSWPTDIQFTHIVNILCQGVSWSCYDDIAMIFTIAGQKPKI